VAPVGGIGERYATEVGFLWVGLARTLGELERLAADPSSLEDAETSSTLRRLQYNLHRASEDAFGFAPPSGVEPIHEELAAALAGARDATADVADAVEDDDVDSALAHLHEWRGALFRVRLARLRLEEPEKAAHDTIRIPSFRVPLVACLLVLGGAAAFTSGAVAGLWPLWAAGLLAVCGSFLTYKP
jgi:hypothetical protein